jgi:hypothetical protein
MQERGIYLGRRLRLRQSFFPAEDWLVN